MFSKDGLALPEAVIAPPVKKSPRLSPRTILLIDVDSRLPNLAFDEAQPLFQRPRTDACVWLDVRAEFWVQERVYGSSVFYTNASTRRVQKLRDFYGDALMVGGSGVDIEQRPSCGDRGIATRLRASTRSLAIEPSDS